MIYADKLSVCHILHIGVSARKYLVQQLPTLRRAGVLTVSERSVSISPGQVIGFPAEMITSRLT